jgi:hypothetical protein
MIYQRGGTYEIVLTGNTLIPSLEMDVDLYTGSTKVGRMSLVPYNVDIVNGNYQYSFNLRPYDYLSNYVKTEHYQFYWLYDWYKTTEQINLNNPYPNIISANFKYGYRYLLNGKSVTEYTTAPQNVLDHYTDIPSCVSDSSFIPSGFTNTGNIYNYVGGQFQMDDKFILPNFDQEIGTVVGTGLTINTVDIYRRLSPMGQYLMDYPTVPEASETARFLTDAPRIQYIQPDENYVLYYLNGQTGDRQVIEADYAVFEFYNDNDSLIQYFEQELNFASTTYAAPTNFTDTLSVFALPCGPADILNIFSSFDISAASYYRVQLFYAHPTSSSSRQTLGPIGPVSEAFYFNIYNNCLPENTRIAFLNQRGGYDYYTFQSYRQDTKKIKTSSYDNRYYSTSLSSPDRNVGRVTKTFDINVDQEMVLESDYLSVPYAQWLEQLFTSPQVYEMKPDFISPMDRQDKVYKDLTPLTVISTEVQTVTKKHQKLNKYRITFATANSYFTNKGF